MRPNTFGVHFIVRSNRKDIQGYVPVYAKVFLNGEILMISINHKIKLSEWHKTKEQPKQNSKSFELINNALEAFKSRIYQAYSKIIATDEALTAENLKAAFYGKPVERVKVYTLIETFKEHNKYFESMIGVKYSYGSYKNYKTTLKYLIEFIPEYAKKKDIPLKEVNYKFCEAYYQFLITQKTCNVNGANKQIQRVKKVINEAIRKGFINSNPMATFKLQFTPVNKIALTLLEIQSIRNLDLQRKVLLDVRDVFLLQCYTGLSYSDIKRLTIDNIQQDEKGNYWIKMERLKTKIAFSVPILQPALFILEKYGLNSKDKMLILPVISNQKMNDNLKIIQELAGISKNLTTHLARHSFATTITLNNGVPLETVSKMLGQTKLSTTQQYAKVQESKIGKDMQGLMEKIK